MNTSAFKFSLAAHAKNCSDVLCVLPECVNRKLASSRFGNQAKQTNKRNRLTSDTDSRKDGKLHRSEVSKDVMLPIQSHPSQDDGDETLKQLLDELEDFKKDFQGSKAELQCSLVGPFDDASQVANPLFNHISQEGFQLPPSDGVTACWSQSGSQQLQYASCEPAHKTTTCEAKESSVKFSPKTELFTDEKISTLGLCLEQSKANCTESDFHHFDVEQFIPMDPYVECSSSRNEYYITAASALADDQSIVRRQIPPTAQSTVAIEKIVCNLKDNKEELRQKKSRSKEQPSKPHKLFAILSEILRMFEDPTSVDRVAFYEEVLQKALTEIKGVKISACLNRGRNEQD